METEGKSRESPEFHRRWEALDLIEAIAKRDRFWRITDAVMEERYRMIHGPEGTNYDATQ